MIRGEAFKSLQPWEVGHKDDIEVINNNFNVPCLCIFNKNPAFSN